MDSQRSKNQAVYVDILSKNKKDIKWLLLFGTVSLAFGFGL